MVMVALSPSERLLDASLVGSSTLELRILDLASSQVDATCKGVHDDYLCDLSWRAFERSGAHPLVISFRGGVVQLFEVPEEVACLRNPLRLDVRIRLTRNVYAVSRLEGELRCLRERLMRRPVCGSRSLFVFL